MLVAITILLVCQLAGEVLARSLGLPMPGPVVGLMLLAVALFIREHLRPGLADSDMARTGTLLSGALGLLFVPTGVGVVQQFSLLGAHWFAILATLVLSALATLLATVGVFLWVKHLLARSAA